jgi:HNH endonuclease
MSRLDSRITDAASMATGLTCALVASRCSRLTHAARSGAPRTLCNRRARATDAGGAWSPVGYGVPTCPSCFRVLYDRMVLDYAQRRAKQPWAAEVNTPCQEWQGATGATYGKHGYRARWIRKYGPLPRRVFLHHACLNRRCINVEHLFPMTPEEHNLEHAYLAYMRPARDVSYRLHLIPTRGQTPPIVLSRECGDPHVTADHRARGQYCAVCGCGWHGSSRTSVEAAQQDLLGHAS